MVSGRSRSRPGSCPCACRPRDPQACGRRMGGAARSRTPVRNFGHGRRHRHGCRRTRRPRPLRGGHRHRGPLPAEDGLEDVLRLLERLRRRAAEQPHLPGLPGPSGNPADDQQARRRACPGDWRRDRRRDAAGDPLGPQELLLSGSAEGLPDQPVRPAAGRARTAWRSRRARARSRSGSPGRIWRRTPPSSSTRPTTPASG